MSNKFKVGIKALEDKNESVGGRFDHGASLIQKALAVRGVFGNGMNSSGNDGK